MATAHDIDWPAVLAERVTPASPDVLREPLALFIYTLMGAEVDALYAGRGYGQRSSDWVNQRIGYRHRQFDTRAGSIDLAISKLWHASYFPAWPLERRKRAERALTTVVATCYLLGVSTRGIDKLVDPRASPVCRSYGVNVHALIAVGVSAEGYREILGIDVTTAEDGASWTAACPGSDWSPATPTPGSSRQSARPCPGRPGSGVALIAPPI